MNYILFKKIQQSDINHRVFYWQNKNIRIFKESYNEKSYYFNEYKLGYNSTSCKLYLRQTEYKGFKVGKNLKESWVKGDLFTLEWLEKNSEYYNLTIVVQFYKKYNIKYKISNNLFKRALCGKINTDEDILDFLANYTFNLKHKDKAVKRKAVKALLYLEIPYLNIVVSTEHLASFLESDNFELYPKKSEIIYGYEIGNADSDSFWNRITDMVYKAFFLNKNFNINAPLKDLKKAWVDIDTEYLDFKSLPNIDFNFYISTNTSKILKSYYKIIRNKDHFLRICDTINNYDYYDDLSQIIKEKLLFLNHNTLNLLIKVELINSKWIVTDFKSLENRIECNEEALTCLNNDLEEFLLAYYKDKITADVDLPF